MKGFEIRRNEDGTLDEVVVSSDDKTLSFHLEQNSKGSWYFGLYGPGTEGDYHQFNIYRDKKRVVVSNYEDSPEDFAIRRKPYITCLCGDAFETIKSMDEHIHMVHDDEEWK